MPFRFEELEERFAAALQSKRLAHAYLLSGNERNELQRLAERLAGLALGESHQDHPDVHWVQPESKSRRIRVEQVRMLEHDLQLKAFRAPWKVGVIIDAERMCLGQAEPANAFLKTLEEPPDSTLLLLCSTQPQTLLPTILSRCIRLDLHCPIRAWDDPDWPAFTEGWNKIRRTGFLRGYERARLLLDFWQRQRARIEEEFQEALDNAEDEDAEDAVKALIEGELLDSRQRTIAELQRLLWSQIPSAESGENPAKIATAPVQQLDGLARDLQTTMDVGMAVEHAFLAMEN